MRGSSPVFRCLLNIGFLLPPLSQLAFSGHSVPLGRAFLLVHVSAGHRCPGWAGAALLTCLQWLSHEQSDGGNWGEEYKMTVTAAR